LHHASVEAIYELLADKALSPRRSNRTIKKLKRETKVNLRKANYHI